MEQFGIFALIILGMLLLMGTIAIVVMHQEQRRTENLRQAGAELAFDFCDEDDELLARLGGFNLFSQGRSRKLNNVMRGVSSDTNVSIFDYRFTTGSGKNSSTHKQTGISFASDRLDLPKFELRPEHWFHKIGAMFGYEDIDFEDFPEFSRKYLLRSDDEQGVRDLFTADVVEHFESLAGICAEGHAGRLIVYRAGTRVKPFEVRQFLETGFGIYAALAKPNRV